jgi:hypothetical protein
MTCSMRKRRINEENLDSVSKVFRFTDLKRNSEGR